MYTSIQVSYGAVSPLSIKALILAKHIYVWSGKLLHDEMSKNLNLYGEFLIPLFGN